MTLSICLTYFLKEFYYFLCLRFGGLYKKIVWVNLLKMMYQQNKNILAKSYNSYIWLILLKFKAGKFYYDHAILYVYPISRQSAMFDCYASNEYSKVIQKSVMKIKPLLAVSRFK